MSPTESEPDGIQSPPTSVWGIVRRLGPGLIVAGSIVGSGELIATTKSGAEAGFWLLWLIIVGCVIKVFSQIEFGRFSIVTGQTTMDGLAQVPGPRIAGRGNWIVWYWFLMFLASISQLGGIVGAVGQALAISAPLTREGRAFNEYVTLTIQRKLAVTAEQRGPSAATSREKRDDRANRSTRVQQLDAELSRRDQQIISEIGLERFEQLHRRPPAPWDDRLWATLIAVITAVVLVLGRYRSVEAISTVTVAMFTLVTIVNVIMLQSHAAWTVTWPELWEGLQFRLPPADGSSTARPVATALATFGIIGVGAAELIAYPYWCLEKGYARCVGPRNEHPEWAGRAQGWMRVMRWDAWCSLVIYTFATVAFYVLGAAILGRSGLNPEKNELIQTLTVMYEPVFGRAAQVLFLCGAFAVLYSTYFVANAGHARVFSDALRVLGFATATASDYRRRVRILSGVFPLACLGVYLVFPQPTALVLLSGLMQAIMLPMLAGAALFFRYRRCDPRLEPGRLWDVLLWISAAGMFVAGVWALVSQFQA
ncbi:MAG: Nramp family divalent metal transporter [Pirellulaceae bacterium]